LFTESMALLRLLNQWLCFVYWINGFALFTESMALLRLLNQWLCFVYWINDFASFTESMAYRHSVSHIVPTI